MTVRQTRLGLGVLVMIVLIGSLLFSGFGEVQAEGAAASKNGKLGDGEGAAFAMTNATKDNRIVRYRRAADGSLERVGSTSTRGNGIGVDLDTQGPLRLSDDHRFLYAVNAVNAGSDDVTVFSVMGTKLKFEQKVYAGDEPVSLTIHDDVLYVLDGSVASNSIRGFKVASNGRPPRSRTRSSRSARRSPCPATSSSARTAA